MLSGPLWGFGHNCHRIWSKKGEPPGTGREMAKVGGFIHSGESQGDVLWDMNLGP